MIENNILSMLEIIAGTPFWVWILFCYIIFKGLKATRNHVISLPKIFIIPAILMGIMLLENNSNIALYLLFLNIGVGIGILLSFNTPITILKESKAIRHLSKPAYKEEFKGDTLLRTAAYIDIREDKGLGSTSKLPLEAKFGKMSIEVPGTYSKLIILLIFFSIKYSFGYMKATNPDLALQYSFLETITTALISGYFLGIAICYTYRFYNRPFAIQH